MAKKTIEQRKRELEAQMEALDALEVIEREINDLATSYKTQFERACTITEQDGYEPTQATNSDGELLWKYEYRYYTQAELKEKGIEDAEPYYRAVYKEKKVRVDELDSWDKPRALAYKRLANFFANLDVDDIIKNGAVDMGEDA